MKRALTNYFVDVIIGIAFLVAAVSSIVFLLPSSWVSLTGSGQTSLLGVDMATWSFLHKWSGIAMVGGVVLHTLLHTRWIVSMTRRVFGRRPQAKPRPARGVAAAPAAPLVAAGSPPVAMTTERPSSRRAEPNDRAADGSRRYTRKAFLGAAATVVAGAAVIGVALRSGGSDVQIEEAAGSSAQSTEGTTQDTTEPAPQSQTDDAAAQSGSTAQASARVVVDDNRCTACGHCLQTCPQGVFDFDSGSGKVVAASPDACTLCGRCVQVCQPQAITLNA